MVLEPVLGEGGYTRPITAPVEAVVRVVRGALEEGAGEGAS